ncbi:MAG: tyrosine-type recombinase/integrase [bacterium]|nr:tyrosine-type recombinase/integrase [bacterium]MCY3891626.1 tyrosine-type recombinase/integrase [bacterium]
MPKLTAAQVKAVSEPGRYGDGDGLYLTVSPRGSKSWVQRIMIDGRRRDIGLGGFPTVSLAQARLRATDNRQAVAEGHDPLLEKRRAAMPTFREAVRTVHEANKPRWRNARHTASWLQSLETYAMPILGGIPLDRIQQSDILGVLTPIWSTRPETARRVRQRIRTVLRWGMAHGYIDRNVAGEVIDGALPPMPKVKNHLRALPYQEVPKALAIVESSQASLAVRYCLRFLILTAARSGEARGATWAEIDLDEKEWRLPGSRMKNGAEHRVPLSDAALKVLVRAKRLNNGSGLVFPSPLKPGSPLSDMTLTKVLRDTGLAERATVHGFRSSFRTWALEQTDTPWAVAEASLAHTLGNDVEQAYVRSSLLDRRRNLMAQWADFVEQPND